ncbi:MAG: hypothetical protein ACREP9_16680 [Candidatus Dormibacteraceae bacterium]
MQTQMIPRTTVSATPSHRSFKILPHGPHSRGVILAPPAGIARLLLIPGAIALLNLGPAAKAQYIYTADNELFAIYGGGFETNGPFVVGPYSNDSLIINKIPVVTR